MNAPFTFADAAAAAAILPRIDRREAEADFLHDLAARDASIRALLLDGTPAGVVQTLRGRNAFLYVYLLPPFRGRGLGREAASLLEEELRRGGAETIVTAWPAENGRAAAFAEKLGWRRTFRSACMVYDGGPLSLGEVPVRQYQDGDYDEAHALYADAFYRMRLSVGDFPHPAPRLPSGEERRRWAETAADRLVWQEGDELAAYVHLEPPEIASVAVKPALQGRGIGRRLVTYLVNDLLSRGHREVRLWCVVGNEPARRLYDSLGFRETVRTAYAEKTVFTDAPAKREEELLCS